MREAGGEVRLLVRDHGPGVPQQAREHLFERFWRREGGRERGRAGAGLGLAIVQTIVSAHHGRITVGDTPGGGAEFAIVLPPAAQQGAGPNDATAGPGGPAQRASRAGEQAAGETSTTAPGGGS